MNRRYKRQIPSAALIESESVDENEVGNKMSTLKSITELQSWRNVPVLKIVTEAVNELLYAFQEEAQNFGMTSNGI